ncbi:MAG: hypothetical protein JWM08_2226 [Candidatus Angelobacter sp.]|nr:hypothetical protein [Candidatus Angelobacter sp.]
MAPKSETIDLLILSRSLIAPLRFNRATDRFNVAAHVLAAHDAAELAISAICIELAIPGISDSRALGLPDYLAKLKEHCHPDRDVSAKDYVSKLNRVRVDLKHHGITPDKDQWGSVAEKMFGLVSTWCRKYLSLDYAEVDAADLIRVASVRDLVRLSRSCLDQGQFKNCLEHLGEAIAKASVELFPRGVHVNVGDPDAETALALSGYGVDPARFMVLQRLLPTYTSLMYLLGNASPLQWKKTEYGHKANWTQQNAEFAYKETVDLLTRLQSANPYPTPYLFDDVFRSVLVVKTDSPKVTVMYWGLDGWFRHEEHPLSFSVGDRIECRARGTNGAVWDPDVCDEDPETCKFVVALDAIYDEKTQENLMRPTLIFQREDVEIADISLSES